MNRVIAITGGIGAGKSVVSRVLRSMGYPVYDCDFEAKALMDNDSNIRRRIAEEISMAAINADGSINRPTLSAVVFADKNKLNKLNSIVHGAVREHFCQWVNKQTANLIFVETAILYESEFDKLVDDVWEVTAPQSVRIQRVMQRNGLRREEVEQRINSQANTTRPGHKIIINDGNQPLIPQILNFVNS